MIKDIRCDEIRNNPAEVIPEYFGKGWLGGATLKSAWENVRGYKKSKGKTRQMYDEGQMSEIDYVLAAEQAFLYGKAGKRVIINSIRAYILAKIKKTPIADFSDKLIEIEEQTEKQNEKKQSFRSGDIVKEQAENDDDTPSTHCSNDIMEKVRKFDKDHVWMFDAGHNGRRDFRGNPKYLFAYINNYRPDILAYWYCEADATETHNQVRNLGWYCVLQGSKEANYLLSKTGVVVSEQLRETLPTPLFQAKYLNLWHGIGFKRIERSRLSDNDDLRIGISKKYISFNSFFMNNQLLVVNSPTYEKEFLEDFGIAQNHVLRTGYLRCQYQKFYEPVVTFNHDICNMKGLPKEARLAVYAPTFRAKRGTAFVDGIKDIGALYKKCEEQNILMIFKVHPHIEKEPGFLNAWEKYGDKPYFLFWDNANDFYEIMDQIDLVIYDYSSMFSDFLCAGVKHFIRYIYDEDEYMAEGFTQGKEAYYERTCGITCHTFKEMLDAIDNYEAIDMSEETQAIYEKLWAYAGSDDFKKTIQATLDFVPENKSYPTLYSFDVFDTLISRKGLSPYSIFYKVAECMKIQGGYQEDFITRYASIRHGAEMNVREYYKKTTQIRHSEKVEIQMYEIFERIRDVYRITEAQSRQLMEWEIEAEIESVIPVVPNIEKLKSLVYSGETVVLISDMYLPEAVIKKMLAKVDVVLADLPLFVSSEYGVQKTSRLLYFEVYRSFKPYYRFGKWIHYGDTPTADKVPAERVGIHTILVDKPEISDVETSMIEKINNYDSYLYTAMCARLRNQMRNKFAKADFVIDIVGSTLIPYVDLVLRDALEKRFEVLYFVARDGYFLKKIADILIAENGWKIDTRYLYASRRTWRVQSYFDEIDETFWITQGGNFNDIHSKEYLLKALYIDEETFKRLCPQIDLDTVDWNAPQPGQMIASLVQRSEGYHKYLLHTAKELRILPCKYLKQELDVDKKIAFVEYWGRGYNQECMNRLWSYVTGRQETSYYYYARSILPSDEFNKRIDMTDLDINIALFEAVFANMPYSSIEEYREAEGKIEPIINPNVYFDKSLFEAMEWILPEMAKEYAKLEFIHDKDYSKALFDFSLLYVYENRYSKLIAENIGGLRYSMSMYGKLEEYAPAYTMADLDAFANGKPRGDDTLSIQMSYGRATDSVKTSYDAMFQVENGEDPFKSPRLSKSEITSNANFKKKYEEVSERAEKAKRYYHEVCKQRSVFNKVTIVSSSKNFDDDVFFTLKKIFDYNQDFIVEWLSADITSDKDQELMRQLALAKVVIVYGNVIQLLKINFRRETACISLLDRGFRLYHFGKNENVKLQQQYRYDTLVHTRHPNMIESTSDTGVELSGFTMDTDNTIKLRGACVTDVLFDIDFKNQSLEKVHSIVPETAGKRLIVYMPTPRLRKNSGNWLELLDIEKLADKLCGEYYMLLDFRSNNALADKSQNLINISGFSKNVSKEKLSLRNLLAVADIVIGDYRDTFFESALLGVPVYSTAVDMDEKQSSSNNLAYNLREMYPFPIIHDEEEFVDYLERQDEYDFDSLKGFKETNLVGCDGKMSVRIMEFIKKLK